MDEKVVALKGVSYDPQPGGGSRKNPVLVWRVRLTIQGRETTVGRYATIQEANAAVTAQRLLMSDPVIDCDVDPCASHWRCEGCQGWRLRSAEAMLYLPK